MAGVKVEIDWRGLQGLIESLATLGPVGEQALLTATEKSVRLVEGEAKARVPRRTGRLLASIHGEVRSPTEGVIGTNVGYGAPIEYGAKPHYIVGRNGMLKFRWHGETIFRPWVWHPGNREYRYLRGALEESEDTVFEFYGDAGNDMLKHLAD